MKSALENILLNTYNKEFDDLMYKSGVLVNIQMALGKEEYDKYIETHF